MSLARDLLRLERDVGELLERHDRARSFEDFARYHDDPVGFLRDVLHADPWSRQVEIAELVRDCPRVAVRSSNAAGKDWLAARLALWWVYARRGLAILTGPTERQVKQILMRQVRRAFAAAPDLPGELFSMELRIEGAEDAGLLAYTGGTAVDNLSGFHAPSLFVAVTEASGDVDAIFDAAFACLTSEDSRLLVCGNPLRPAGRFYEASRSDNWRNVRIPASEHPNVVQGREVIPGGPTREWIAAVVAEFGAGSAYVTAHIEAEFPEDILEGLVSRAWVNRAFELHESGALAQDARDARWNIVLDVARFGPDRTVMGLVRWPVIERFESWHGAALTETVERVMKAALPLCTVHSAPATWCTPAIDREVVLPRVTVDEVGLGGGVVDWLRKDSRMSVFGYNGARRAARSRRFFNARSEDFFTLRDALRDGKIALPRSEDLAAELMALEWSVNNSGQIVIESKDVLRGKLGRSIDYADVCAMAAHGHGGSRVDTTITKW